jgi:homoserine dehydrogenase
MIKIALLGFGNVGRAFLHHVEKTGADAEYPVWAIADITGGLILHHAEDARWLLQMQTQGRTVADFAGRGSFFFAVPSFIYNLPQADIKVLVECMPTSPVDGQPALDLLRQAIDAGLHVVTVDKGPLVHGFDELVSAARRQGTNLAYSGTTGVRPPSGIAGCHVMDIRGILNGTTNFILSEMQDHGVTFRKALALAVENGIAEPNPELDLQGWDTACKILILANEWMHAGASLSDVARIGIGPETESLIAEGRRSGRYVRLVGHARLQEGRPRLTVAPTLLAPESLLHPISGTSKGAIFTTREKGEIFAAGVSGREAIAQTILDDVKAVTAGSGPAC